MGFDVTRKGDFFIVSCSKPILYPNLELGRRTIVRSFQENGAVFEEPLWTEDRVHCTQREGYWNHLQFKQLGSYQGRRMGLVGSTSGLSETFCGPEDLGDVIINEAAIRQRCWGGGNPYYIEGRKAEQIDRGSIIIAFILPEQVSPNAKLEELFEQGVTHTEEIRLLLSA